MTPIRVRIASGNPTAKVVDLAAYRAARREEQDRLPLFAVPAPAPPSAVRAVLSDNEIAHRERMLRHLGTGPNVR